jgi:CheY-like chemotaxis protein
MFKLLSFQASQKGLEFVHSIDSDIPQFLVGNPTRLRQIIVNLVGNAIKFTPKGGVAALVKSELVDQDAITLLFIINDTGIGIPEDKQDLIFDSFMQADGAMTRQYGGTGLGLTISKRLVQMMHGNIWVDSEVGEGSSFYFTAQFGLPKVQPLIAQIKNASLLKNIPVLILDNNETTGRNLLEMLNGYDMKPQWVREIPSAIETLENGIKIGAPFKVAVIDCNLPNLDSVNMAERLKTFTEKSELKLIVLTVGGWRGDTERCRQAGISAYLTKPVNQTDLIDAIRTALRYTAQNDQAPLITRHSLRESRKNIQILLTEDNPINQKLSVAILEKKGYTVHVANNGREAIEAYHRKRYDVILMDIQMPELDGFEATEIIRQHEQETGLHVPIIAMTAHAMKGDKERCLSVGMDGYISKPVEPKTLYKIIEDFTN